MKDSLSRFTIEEKQETTQEFIYKNKIISEINKNEAVPEGIFSIILKSINQYCPKDPFLIAKYIKFTYKKGYICQVINTELNLITCKGVIFTLLIL